MSHSSYKHLEDEMKAILQNHLTNLKDFTDTFCPNDLTLSPTTQKALFILEQYCQYNADKPGKETYGLVQEALNKIQYLLRLTNQPVNSIAFKNTRLGHSVARAINWCDQFAALYDAPIEKVWEVIAPAVPDTLQKVEHNIYEAIWWKSVPKMDIEILQRTEHIEIESPPYEPSNIPGAIAVRFTVNL